MVNFDNIKFGKVDKIAKTDFKIRDIKKLSKFETISPPSIFIGSKLAYPLVNVGIMSPVGEFEDAQVYDDCRRWAREDFSVQDVIGLRTGLLNSRFRSEVTDVRKNNKFLDVAKDIALAAKPVDVEIELSNRISSRMGRDQVLTPHGMNAGLKAVAVTSNVKIEKVVDRVANDEIKSVEGMNILYDKGIDEYSVSKILSVGVMGLSKDKKIVPTRWSITATDDILSKEILKRVRTYPEITDYELHLGEFMGNQYLILLFPDVFNFELFELYYPGSSWNPGTDMKASHDYEGFRGRTSYAENCVGGYYATRFPVVEYLDKIKRQASVLAIRLETPSYWAALGVWVVRESVRRTMGLESGQSVIDRRSIRFGDEKEFLEGVRQIGKIKFDFDSQVIYDKSWYLKEMRVQRKLRDF